MGSLQSALLGYGIFRGLSSLRPPHNRPFLGFTVEENVVLQVRIRIKLLVTCIGLCEHVRRGPTFVPLRPM
jgi:hypothetical protein